MSPEMLRAFQASLAEAFRDRDAARRLNHPASSRRTRQRRRKKREFLNCNAAVSDDAVDAA